MVSDTYVVTPVGKESQDIALFSSQMHLLGVEWVPVTDGYTDLATLNQLEGEPHLIRRSDRIGLAMAYRLGIMYALSKGARKIIEIDVGHPGHLALEMIDLLDSYPLVCSSRFMPSGGYEGSKVRESISRVGNFLCRTLLGMKFSDCTGGFIGYKGSVALPVFQSSSHAHQIEFKFHRRDQEFIEIPLKYVCGTSSFKWRAIWDGVKVLGYCLWIRICSR